MCYFHPFPVLILGLAYLPIFISNSLQLSAYYCTLGTLGFTTWSWHGVEASTIGWHSGGSRFRFPSRPGHTHVSTLFFFNFQDFIKNIEQKDAFLWECFNKYTLFKVWNSIFNVCSFSLYSMYTRLEISHLLTVSAHPWRNTGIAILHFLHI